MMPIVGSKPKEADFYFNCRVLKYGNVYDILKSDGKRIKMLGTYYPRTDKLTVFNVSVDGVYSLIGMEEWFQTVKEELV